MKLTLYKRSLHSSKRGVGRCPTSSLNPNLKYKEIHSVQSEYQYIHHWGHQDIATFELVLFKG